MAKKGYKRKGTPNSDVVKSVFGSDYVSQYDGATSDKPNQKSKEPKRNGLSKSPPPVHKQKPKSTPDLPVEVSKKAKPLDKQNNQLGTNSGNIITNLIKSFDFSYEELSINFKEKKVVVKDSNKVYHVFGFDGKEQVKYSFNENKIEVIKKE